MKVPVLAGAVAAMCALTLAACGSDSSTTSTSGGGATNGKPVDVGSMTVTQRGPLRIAYFLAGLNNSYLQSQKAAAEEWSQQHDVPVTIFDGKFDATQQFNQIQNALQSGKYNAAVVEANDTQLECKILTEQAPQKGWVVSNAQPLCGRAANEGDELWAPGTLNFIGGNHTHSYFTKYFMKIAAENPGPQVVLALKGPALDAITVNFDKAIAEVQARYPDFKVVAEGETDYSTPLAQERMVPMIQAHPDATILLSTYSNVTKGAVQALKAAGKLDDIRIYEKGGTTWAVQAVKDGTIVSTTPEHPQSSTRASLDSLLHAYQTGDPGPRFIPNDGAPLPKEADPRTGLIVLTKENIDSYTPENE